MKALLIVFVLSLPNFSLAQNLPDNVTCQDLIDLSNGRLSRIADGGNTYVPIRAPQPKDAFGAALISHDTYLCQRLSRGEISVAEFTALHDEKALQLQVDRAKVLTDRQKVLMEQKNLENQQKALQNQQEALHNQEAAIQTQREAVQTQRQTVVIQALQAEAARRQAEAHHRDWLRQQQIQQQQLEQIRQEQSRPKTLSCFGGGNYIHCN